MASRLQDVLLRGVAASRPAATAVANGTLYWATDTQLLTQSDGAVWSAYSAAASAPVTPGITFVAEVICSGSTATETFSAIAGTYRHLEVWFTGRVTSAGSANHNIYVQFNGDTAANYDNQGTYATNVSPGAYQIIGTAQPAMLNAPEASVTAGLAGGGRMSIPYYANTSFHKTALSVNTSKTGNVSAGTGIFSSVMHWRNTAAITSVTLGVLTSGNFTSGTRISLYGVT